MTTVAIIHPNAVREIYGPLAQNFTAIEQPLWVRLIAGYLRDKGFVPTIIDAEARRIDPMVVADEIAALRPDLVVIVVAGHQPSASTQQMPGSGEVARQIKFRTPEQRILMVGDHPSALPVRTLHEEAVDYVCDGEGPMTVEGLLLGSPLPSIPGLVWRDGEQIRQNSLAPLLDLDRHLHGQTWDLFDMGLYRSHNWQRLGEAERRQPYAAIYTSLGCSFKCSFCMINVFQHTNRYRMRPPQAVVKEMAMLNRQYGVKTFKFIDELFVLNVRHYTEICRGLIASGLGGQINSWCYSRTDTVKQQHLSLLRDAGFCWLGLGVESGSENIRQSVDKGRSSNETIIATMNDIRRADINIAANFIFGLPEDDAETMQATLDLAMEINPEWANFYCAMAYPGSLLYDEAVNGGWQLPSSWSGYSQHSFDTFPLSTRHLSPAEVLRFRDDAFRVFYTSPSYQSHVLTKFGPGALAEIQEMVRVPLKRKLLGD